MDAAAPDSALPALLPPSSTGPLPRTSFPAPSALSTMPVVRGELVSPAFSEHSDDWGDVDVALDGLRPAHAAPTLLPAGYAHSGPTASAESDRQWAAPQSGSAALDVSAISQLSSVSGPDSVTSRRYFSADEAVDGRRGPANAKPAADAALVTNDDDDDDDDDWGSIGGFGSSTDVGSSTSSTSVVHSAAAWKAAAAATTSTAPFPTNAASTVPAPTQPEDDLALASASAAAAAARAMALAQAHLKTRSAGDPQRSHVVRKEATSAGAGVPVRRRQVHAGKRPSSVTLFLHSHGGDSPANLTAEVSMAVGLTPRQKSTSPKRPFSAAAVPSARSTAATARTATPPEKIASAPDALDPMAAAVWRARATATRHTFPASPEFPPYRVRELLWSTFHYFASRGDPTHADAMGMHQFRQFVRACGAGRSDAGNDAVPSSQVDLVFLRRCRSSAMPAGSDAGATALSPPAASASSSRSLSYDQFQGACVDLARLTYPHQTYPLQLFMMRHLLRVAHQEGSQLLAAGSTSLCAAAVAEKPAETYQGDALRLLHANHKLLGHVFHHYSQEASTMTFSACLAFARDFDVVPTVVSTAQLLVVHDHVLRAAMCDPDTSAASPPHAAIDARLEDDAMTFRQWVDLLVRLGFQLATQVPGAAKALAGSDVAAHLRLVLTFMEHSNGVDALMRHGRATTLPSVRRFKLMV